MKLHEFKSRYMPKLAMVKPKNSREKELIDIVMVKLYNLKTHAIPDLVFTLYQIMKEDISADFRSIIEMMIEDLAETVIEDRE